MLTLLFLLTSYTALADNEVGIGPTVGNEKGASLGDFRIFDPHEIDYGYYRYGSSFARWTLGNELGLSLTSLNGVILDYTRTGPLVAFIGLEPVSGKLVLSTKQGVENYYQWVPAVSTGLKFHLLGVTLIGSIRAGESVGSQGYTTMTPRGNTAYGYSAYLHTSFLKLGYERLIIGNDCILNNYDVQFSHLGIRYEKNKGLFQEDNFSILYKF